MCFMFFCIVLKIKDKCTYHSKPKGCIERRHSSIQCASRLDDGRRPYTASIDIVPKHHEQKQMFGGSDFEDSDANATFINEIRTQVKRWRENNYSGVTRITRELLNYWFKNPERQWHLQLFFCQREAIETAIYLNEVADLDPNIGRDLLRQLNERLATVSDDMFSSLQ